MTVTVDPLTKAPPGKFSFTEIRSPGWSRTDPDDMLNTDPAEIVVDIVVGTAAPGKVCFHTVAVSPMFDASARMENTIDVSSQLTGTTNVLRMNCPPLVPIPR